MNTVFALDQSFSRTNTLKSRCQSSSLNTETKKFRKRSELPWPTGARAARHVAFMRCQCLHVARLSSRCNPVPARCARLLHLPFLRLHREQPLPPLLPWSSAVTSLTRHCKNALPSSPRASLCSSLPPPHRRANLALVRAKSPFLPPPPWRDLTGIGAPCGQPPPWPSRPLSLMR